MNTHHYYYNHTEYNVLNTLKYQYQYHSAQSYETFSIINTFIKVKNET